MLRLCLHYATFVARVFINSSRHFNHLRRSRKLDQYVPNSVLNPTDLVEVYSKSTEKHDRWQKSAHYRQIPSLMQLILISKEESFVECLSRHPSGSWLLTDDRGLASTFVIDSVGNSIPLSEIYRNVQLEPVEVLPEANA